MCCGAGNQRVCSVGRAGTPRSYLKSRFDQRRFTLIGTWAQAHAAESVTLVSKTNYTDAMTSIHIAGRADAGAGRIVGVDAIDPAEAELAARLRMAVTRLHRRLRQQGAGGLTPSQASALVGVEHLGSPTLGTLAARESVQPPTMTKVVGALEALGYVTRVTDPTDRRVARLTITPAGSDTLREIRSVKTAYLADRLRRMAPGERLAMADLTDLLERLIDMEEP